MNTAFTFPSKIIRRYVAHPCLSLLSLLGLSLALMEIIQIGPMPLLPAMLYGVLALSFFLPLEAKHVGPSLLQVP